MSCPVDPHVGQGMLKYEDWRAGDTHWGHRDSDQWPEGHVKPRTCGYCGCSHPDDVAQLIAAGWTLERSTKGYKYYVNAPQVDGKYQSVVPPVKLYTYHVSKDQGDLINEARTRFVELVAQGRFDTTPKPQPVEYPGLKSSI